MSNENSKITPRRASKVLTIVLLLACCTTGFAILPVYDAVSNNTQIILARETKLESVRQFLQTMERFRAQFEQGKEAWAKVDQMRGNWKNPLQSLSDAVLVKVVKNDEVRDLSRLGWDMAVDNKTESISNVSEKALERIEKLMSNQATANSLDSKYLRDDLHEIYGETPATRPDVEAAHRTIARAMATTREINAAIAEQRKQIDAWKKKISGGGLVPGDLERYSALISAAQQDINLLQTRVQTIALEVQATQTGLQAANVSQQETARLQAQSEAANFISGAGKISN